MYPLISAVAAIALVASVTTATISYTPWSAIQKKMVVDGGVAGLESLEASAIRFLDDTRDMAGQVQLPTTPDGNLLALVSPVYGFVPATVQGMGWAMAPGAIYGQNAVSICYLPATTKGAGLAGDALPLVQAKLPAGSSFIGTSCGATTNTANGTYLTKWLLLSHLD